MKTTVRYLFFAVALLFCAVGYSQSKTSLEKQKRQLQDDMSRLNAAIAANTKNQKSKTVELQTLRSKVRIREKLIKTINTDIGILDSQIGVKTTETQRLTRELDTLKASYAKMCVSYEKNKSSGIRLMYILSSDSFLQAYRRGKYIQEYVDAIRKRGQEVRSKHEQAQKALAELRALRGEKTKLLAEQTSEMDKLKADQTKIQGLLSSLQKNKKQLEKELSEKKKNATRIQQAIDDIIAKELAAQRKKSGGKGTAGAGMTPEAKQLSADFAQNKGRLPWPVGQGMVYIPFGNQTYPGLNVQISNPGISISTPEGTNARAVFSGTVTRVQKQNGLINVFVSHGKYFTVYGDLVSVQVKQGDKVSTKQVIGKIYTDKFENKTILTFCVFDGTEKQDPELWLAR